MESHKLSVSSFGLALGITWAVGMLLIGLGSTLWGLWPNTMSLFGEWYVGFAPTWGGSFIGAVWGFLDGLIGGAVVAWLYNLFQK